MRIQKQISEFTPAIAESRSGVEEIQSSSSRAPPADARSLEAKRKKMDPEYLEKLFTAQKTLYSLLLVPAGAVEEKNIPVVEIGIIQEIERVVSKWFPKEYSLIRKRKQCICETFPHLKGYDETMVRFRTKIKESSTLVDVIPLLLPMTTDSISRQENFKDNVYIFADTLKLSNEDMQFLFDEWERILKMFQIRIVSFQKKSPQREWVKRGNELLMNPQK